MELQLYDTLTRKKRVFTPIDPARVRMYVCGPTVYDYAHIGNARPVIVFDVLFRLLRHLAKQGVWDGGKGKTEVAYVRNVTDVDDKINARAAERGISIQELTKTTYDNFKADVAALGCLEPTVEPRATEYVSKPDAPTDMIRLIGQLVKNGCAYVAEGHVLFHVASMKDYGKLSNRSLDDMIAGARVEVAPYKKDPMDFVLWKPSPPELPGWDSPWGRGRPGWHIECSAMSAALLGETFDIHGGGIDLVFPHHENEIAQSRCAFHTPVMANYWMHNGFLQVEGEKMSKSLGNFVTIRDLREGWHDFNWPGDVIRFAMLSTHYRQPLDFSAYALEQASVALDTFSLFRTVEDVNPSDEFMAAMLDDLNTPRAITELHRLYKLARSNISEIADRATRPGAMLKESDFVAAEQLLAGLRFLGIELKAYDPDWARKQAMLGLSASQRSKIDALVERRDTARAAKNFKESDRIRDELKAMGVELEDSKDGKTKWKIAR